MSESGAVLAPRDLVALREQHPAARVIDVRTPGEFAAGHIAGSYNVPLPELTEHRRELTDALAGPVVLVCQSGKRAETAGRQLVAAGLSDVHVLDGGVLAWQTDGGSLQTLDGPAPWTLERQVRGVAGGVVAASIVASLWWPRARFLAGAVGAGLLTAALTNTCMLGNVLSRLPYNRRSAATCDLPDVVSTLTSTDGSPVAGTSDSGGPR